MNFRTDITPTMYPCCCDNGMMHCALKKNRFAWT